MARPVLTMLPWFRLMHASADHCPSGYPFRGLHTGAVAAGTGFAATIFSQFQHNPITTGGLTLMLIGAAGVAAKQIAEKLLEFLKRRLFLRAEIDSRDDAYRWVMHWMSRHPDFARSQHVAVTTSLLSFGLSSLEGSLASNRKILLLPAPGDHLLHYRDRWLWISRKRAGGVAASSAAARLLVETLHITAWGQSRDVVEALLEECQAAYADSSRSRTLVHSVDQDGYWTQVGSRPIRPLKTVVLPGHKADDLLVDCREFLESEAWYAHHGIPYRRGYLLYGPPGTGKTSLVTALAGELKLDVYVVTLSSPVMTDETLRNLLNSAADRCILLLEDVDAAFSEDREAGVGKASSLTFSGLLNAIDGVAAQEGRLLFMTTNHIERLNSALIRPGRVDKRLEFHLADTSQIKRLFMSFYAEVVLGAREVDEEDEELAGVLASDEVKAATEETGVCAAQCADATAPVSPTSTATAATTTGPTIATATTSFQSPHGGAEGFVVSVGGRGQGQAADDVGQDAAPSGATDGRGGAEDRGRGPAGVTVAAGKMSDPGKVGGERGVGSAEVRSPAPPLEELADQFSRQVPAFTVSAAQLQGLLMMYKRDPVAAVHNVGHLIRGSRS